MNVEPIDDNKIANVVLSLLDEPLRLLEIREKLRKNGIYVSYTRLKRIVTMLVNERKIVSYRYGKKVLYAKLY